MDATSLGSSSLLFLCGVSICLSAAAAAAATLLLYDDVADDDDDDAAGMVVITNESLPTDK